MSLEGETIETKKRGRRKHRKEVRFGCRQLAPCTQREGPLTGVVPGLTESGQAPWGDHPVTFFNNEVAVHLGVL